MQAWPSIQYLLHIVLGNCYEKIPGKVQTRPTVYNIYCILCLAIVMKKIPGKVQTRPTVYNIYCILCLAIVMKKYPVKWRLGRVYHINCILCLAIVMKKYLVKCRLEQVYNIYCILCLADIMVNIPCKMQTRPSTQYLLHIVLGRYHDKYTWQSADSAKNTIFTAYCAWQLP